jgi:hypothetical protein
VINLAGNTLVGKGAQSPTGRVNSIFQ